MNCSNCEQPPKDGEYLALTQGSRVVALICSECQQNVLVAKIVLDRPSSTKPLVYQGYLPAKTEK